MGKVMQPPDDLIFTRPLFHEKIWGGRRLAQEFGYAIPSGPIGECWAISAHPAGDCPIEGGAFAGMTLSQLWGGHRELFGEAAGEEFPLLVKILDAEGDLSVQVHPDDAYAAAHESGSLGKCECWYVLHADPGATIVVGQRAHDRASFERGVAAGDWSALLNEMPVHTGDFFQIDPGTVHAIKAGTMILETQQSSDVTYRLYDYDRVQDDGTKRELHIDKCLDVINFEAPVPEPSSASAREAGQDRLLVSCPFYSVSLLCVDGRRSIDAPRTFYCASVIEGEGWASGRAVTKGSHFLVPSTHGKLELDGLMTLVVSTVPPTSLQVC